jgi:hypothetical protein
MVGVVAAELEQVFDDKLFIFAPSDLQSSLLNFHGSRALESLCI